MKTLLILRHAKSSWGEEGLSDHDRPLNERGKRDAPAMGKLLAELNLVPDAVLSSTAKRAISTAKKVAKASGYANEIFEWRELYHAAPETYLAVLRTLDPSIQRVLVIGHNPGLEMLVEALSGQAERMPTAALARIDFELDDWRELGRGAGRLTGLWRPKEL